MMSVAFSSVLMLFANVCSLQSSEGPEAYRRPAFDKSPYAKTVWSQANPWFPPNLSRTHHTPGGPDSSWWTLSSDARIMWRQVAEKMAPYGLTGLQMEITMLDDGRLGWAEVFRSMLEGFEDARVEFFGVPFFSRPAADVASTVKALEELMPLIREWKEWGQVLTWNLR